MNLAAYLQKIARAEPVNYDEFKKRLPKALQLEHHQVFRARKLAAKRYQVEIVDRQRFAELFDAQGDVPLDRVGAAGIGDSHKVSTSFSYMLVYHQLTTGGRPDVVVVEDENIRQGFRAKKQLLIIENEENFFRYDALLPLLSSFAGKPLSLADTDILYGAGNQINKRLNFSLFEQYHSVLCAFDWDLGGLQMFKTLSGSLDKSATFLLPEDLTPWYRHFKYRPQSDQKWLAALALAESLGFDALHQAFRATSCFLEQETWLEAGQVP